MYNSNGSGCGVGSGEWGCDCACGEMCVVSNMVRPECLKRTWEPHASRVNMVGVRLGETKHILGREIGLGYSQIHMALDMLHPLS